MSTLKLLFKPSSDCLIIHLLCVVLTDETSGSDEETMHYYCPASDLGLRSRKKKKPKAQSKTSQSMFSVIISVNHGLVALQTNTKVQTVHSVLSRHSLYLVLCKEELTFHVSPRRKTKPYWKTNMASSGWRWRMLCCSVWRSTKAIKTNTTSASTPVTFACIIKVNRLHYNII